MHLYSCYAYVYTDFFNEKKKRILYQNTGIASATYSPSLSTANVLLLKRAVPLEGQEAASVITLLACASYYLPS
jgi:hypothetical protein